MKRTAFFLGLTLLLARSGVPQTASAPTKPFFFKHFTTKNGLSYNLVNALFEDHEGYVWVGTFNGLNRFDGTRFVSFKYDRNDPHSVAHNNITDLCEDRAGDIWVATFYGVSRYVKAQNTFVNYLLEPHSKDAFRDNVVNNVLCDRDGTVWATSLGGLYEFIPGKNAFKAYRHNPADSTSISSNLIYRNGFVEDPQRPYLWLGTERGLNAFDRQKKVFYHYAHNPHQVPVFNDHAITPLTFDRNGTLIFSDYLAKKLVFYAPKANTATYSEEVIVKNRNRQLSYIATIAADRQNNLWVCAWNNEVYHRDAATDVWHPVLHDDANPASINSQFFWDVLAARDGTVYVGGLYGLSVYRPSASFFTVHRPPAVQPNQPTTHIRAMAEDAAGRVWLAPTGPREGLLRYDFNTRTAQAFPVAGHAPPTVSLRAVFHLESAGEELYLGTDRGIVIFNPQTGNYRAAPGLPSGAGNAVTWCHRDRHGTLWFSLASHWLGQYDERTRRLTRHNLDSLFSTPAEKTTIAAGAEDPSGTMWFGAASGRLYRYDAERARFTMHVPDSRQTPKVLQQSINALYADPGGKIWLATEGGGLVKFDPVTGRFKAWMESDGLLMDVCNSVLPDGQGRLWVGTYEGFTRFDPRNERIENPRMDYGQRENNFFHTSECALRDGRLVFADADNLILIDPRRVNSRQRTLRPLISGITVFEKSRPLYRSSPSLSLSYRENFFTLEFSTLTPAPETPIEYAYRLTNYDKDWVTSPNRSFAAYTGVPGGQYEFAVKARYPNGPWSEPVTLAIRVDPPFWETGWFRALAVLAVAGAGWGLTRQRERRLLREQREKSDLRERIATSEMQALRAQMNPHFIYNSLNAIRLFVLQNDSDNAETYLVKFARLMRLILDNSRQEVVPLGSELDQLQLYLELEQLRFNHAFGFSIQTDPSLSREEVLVPPMIIQPFIENAILHGIAHKKSTGHIAVGIRPVDGHLECTVDDDGVGRQRARELKSKSVRSHQSVGLRVTADRLQLLGQRSGNPASVHVIDKTDEQGRATGTRVVVCLPLVTAKTRNPPDVGQEDSAKKAGRLAG